MARSTRVLALGAVLAAAAALGAGPAVADTGTPSTAPSAQSDAAQKAAQKAAEKADKAAAKNAAKFCARVPVLETRLNKALTRLNGGSKDAGSIAAVQARIDRQKALGHPEIATLLGDRLAARQALLPILTKGKTDLDAVKNWCATQPKPASSPSGKE